MNIYILVGRINVYGIFILTSPQIYFKLDLLKYLKFFFWLFQSARKGISSINNPYCIQCLLPLRRMAKVEGSLLFWNSSLNSVSSLRRWTELVGCMSPVAIGGHIITGLHGHRLKPNCFCERPCDHGDSSQSCLQFWWTWRAARHEWVLRLRQVAIAMKNSRRWPRARPNFHRLMRGAD